MKKNDLGLVLFLSLIFLPFFLSGDLYLAYNQFNQQHGMLMSFVKFAILATLGESIGNRIKSGQYVHSEFGLIPKAIVWGFLGLGIKLAFIVFASGTPVFLSYLGLTHPDETGIGVKLLQAFAISTTMNLIFAPVMMTLHKMTDIHIANNKGRINSLITPMDAAGILQNMDWNSQWNFVFKKTIIFFWIPAHTITFLLPADFQVLFAALLGIVLGILLAISGKKRQIISS
jgi:hypothetical protein